MTPVQQLIESLHWQYGLERTVDIMLRRDPATEADIAAWNRLSGAPATPHSLSAPQDEPHFTTRDAEGPTTSLRLGTRDVSA